MRISPERLRRQRQRLGLSQQQLAARVGLKQPNISRIESGRNDYPRLESIKRLAKALRCKVEDLCY
jgi:transcriptional regulator with XRE-family HTH domain